MPKISIIVPIYNVEQYLKKCVDSILAQTFQDYEIILVNDGSTDACGEICDDYINKDSRIRVIHKKNGGLADARNTGINAANGDYLGFVDSDDWLEPTMYETLYNVCFSENADISTCLIETQRKNKNQKTKVNKKEIKVFTSFEAISSLYEGKLSGFSACNKLYKKSLFENVEFPKGRVYEDAAIMYKLFSYASKIAFVNLPLYKYNYRDHSITRSNFSEKRFDVVANYFETYSFMENNYPEMCEKINFVYYVTLRTMIADIVCEKSIVQNSEYIKRISKHVREVNKAILKNNTITIKHKLLAQVLAWCPGLAVFFYKFFLKTN
ncbi:glycosyltransferase [Domibacillus sp. PGB-M46]|uniref:glycosyltransferase family 2 protein n=1 Tax=Domibacillus sp. PGB-M46 TaxID=2910255 RepID=UPI001F59D813|nr:glycosyltransferase [Domibacillus sp. PGB-M46]MCI2255194.1 glycosyltransferase [Domibacillus sp. PGB-M46]